MHQYCFDHPMSHIYLFQQHSRVVVAEDSQSPGRPRLQGLLRPGLDHSKRQDIDELRDGKCFVRFGVAEKSALALHHLGTHFHSQISGSLT